MSSRSYYNISCALPTEQGVHDAWSDEEPLEIGVRGTISPYQRPGRRNDHDRSYAFLLDLETDDHHRGAGIGVFENGVIADIQFQGILDAESWAALQVVPTSSNGDGSFMLTVFSGGFESESEFALFLLVDDEMVGLITGKTTEYYEEDVYARGSFSWRN